MKLANIKIQLSSALILVGLVFFCSQSAPSALLYRFHRATKSSLYLVPHSQAIGKYKTGKELHREMELDFCTPYFIFLMDQVSESELEIIPSGFVLYDQRYCIRALWILAV